MKPTPAGLEDAGRLAALHAQAFPRPWTEAEVRELMHGAAMIAFATLDGFVLARAIASEAEILTLAVAPEGRRRGAGRALLQAAMDAATGLGADSLFLEVAADNAPALALYAAEDFAEVGLRRAYYPRADGPPVDAITLRRALNRPGT